MRTWNIGWHNHMHYYSMAVMKYCDQKQPKDKN